jgi:hypothetical protein
MASPALATIDGTDAYRGNTEAARDCLLLLAGRWRRRARRPPPADLRRHAMASASGAGRFAMPRAGQSGAAVGFECDDHAARVARCAVREAAAAPGEGQPAPTTHFGVAGHVGCARPWCGGRPVSRSRRPEHLLIVVGSAAGCELRLRGVVARKRLGLRAVVVAAGQLLDQFGAVPGRRRGHANRRPVSVRCGCGAEPRRRRSRAGRRHESSCVSLCAVHASVSARPDLRWPRLPGAAAQPVHDRSMGARVPPRRARAPRRRRRHAR